MAAPATTTPAGGDGKPESKEAPIDPTFGACVPDDASILGGRPEADAPHSSLIGHLIKSLRPGQDLTRVLIPSFFLESRSLLEKMTDVMLHPQLIVGVEGIKDPVERMLQVTKWYLSGWHYKTPGVKKPYNPIIGESFSCYWKHDDGTRSQWFAEQVSHRPPVSAMYFENRAHNIVVNSQVWTKSQFSAPQTAKSVMVGSAQVHLCGLNEDYFMTFPTFYAHNMLIGTLRMEIGDSIQIVCEKTKMSAEIAFQQKPYFGGASKLNSIVGKIKHDGKELYSLDGHWDGIMYITPKGGKKAVFLDVDKTPIMTKYVVPEKLQQPWESRRLWSKVTDALLTRPTVDWSVVDKEKTKLEDEQRKIPCHAKKEEDRKPWATKKFHLKMKYNPITGEDEEMWVFDDINTKKFKKGEKETCLVAMSRSLPDVRTPDFKPVKIEAPKKDAKKDAKKGEAAPGGGGGGGGPV